MPPKKVVVVGAGISGLAVAYRLSQLSPTADITVLERSSRPGGTVWTHRRHGYQVETGPNGFLDNNPATLYLCRNLGIDGRLVPASDVAAQNRYLFLGDRLRRLPRSFPAFLGSGLLSWCGKLALLTERFRRGRKDGVDESVDAFARRRAGREAAEVLADAFVTGIHAGDPGMLSLRAAFPRLAQMEAEHGSLLRALGRIRKQRRKAPAAEQPSSSPGRMWSFPEGLRLLIETLSQKLRNPPVHGATVHEIERSLTGWIVRGEGGQRWTADAVVLACPAYEQAAILRQLDTELAERINGIAYSRVAVVALGYRQADVRCTPAGFGYIAPQRLRRDVLGVQWCSSIFPDRAPAGMVLFRALCGGWNRPDVLDWDDNQLLTAVRAELRTVQGIEAEPVFHDIVRWGRAIPQYHLGHLERVSWIEYRVSRYAGLFLTGNCYRGISLNDCTEQANVLAKRVAESSYPVS
jgi:oxygen-dependent protoporphyrinogen oxidase